MAKGKERVIIDLNHNSRVRLFGRLTAAMHRKGLRSTDTASLDLGFELPAAWPTDPDHEVTLAQLTVLAGKLDMQIVINGLDMIEAESEKIKAES